MPDLINCSLCLSDIPKDKIRQGKNGKLYLSITVAERREADSYGNTHTVYINQTKEERERKDKRQYIGQGTAVVFQPLAPTPEEVNDLPLAGESDIDNLPF